MCGHGCVRITKGLNQEAFEDFLRKRDEEITFLQKGLCYCGGRLFREVIGFFRGKYMYSFPQCEKCRREYLYDLNVPKRGEKEFAELMNQPMTI